MGKEVNQIPYFTCEVHNIAVFVGTKLPVFFSELKKKKEKKIALPNRLGDNSGSTVIWTGLTCSTLVKNGKMSCKEKERIRKTCKALIICARTSSPKLIQVGVK